MLKMGNLLRKKDRKNEKDRKETMYGRNKIVFPPYRQKAAVSRRRLRRQSHRLNSIFVAYKNHIFQYQKGLCASFSGG